MLSLGWGQRVKGLMQVSSAEIIVSGSHDSGPKQTMHSSLRLFVPYGQVFIEASIGHSLYHWDSYFYFWKKRVWVFFFICLLLFFFQGIYLHSFLNGVQTIRFGYKHVLHTFIKADFEEMSPICHNCLVILDFGASVNLPIYSDGVSCSINNGSLGNLSEVCIWPVLGRKKCSLSVGSV